MTNWPSDELALLLCCWSFVLESLSRLHLAEQGSLSGQSTSRRYALAAPFLGLGAGLWKSDGRAERRVDDIHYPAVFLGRWDCESVLTDVNNFGRVAAIRSIPSFFLKKKRERKQRKEL